MEFMQWIAGVGGIGAVFGVIMVYVLLRVLKVMRKDRQFMEDRLTKLIDEGFELRRDSTAKSEKEAEVLTELITYLKLRNGNR